MWKPPECTVSGGFFLLVGWFALCCGWQMALTVLEIDGYVCRQGARSFLRTVELKKE